ncbi:MAG: methionine--tRNA ligase subunit beta [Candidatus Pacebacteria bacterium]|nr:methionine--tRNA ligase subunit beta [Candidatus Paceibacterota bacterium]
MIKFEDFQKIDLRVAKILEAERVKESEKLMKLQIDLGEELGKRQIVAGISQFYTPENLVGQQIIVVANLEPRKLMMQESCGMLLATHGLNGEPVLLIPAKGVPLGSKIS